MNPTRSRWLIPAAVFLFINGFFVARVPDATRPELAGVSAFFVLVLALPTFFALKNWLGLKRAATIFAVLGVFALVFESVAILTGFPYGQFTHGDKIGGKVFGLVPWTVFFAWTPILLAAATLATRFSSKTLPRLAWSALWAMVFDLVLDPGAVLQEFWSFQSGGWFYDVPLSNFLGWLVSGFLGASLVFWLAPRKEKLWPWELTRSMFLILAFWTSVCLFSGLWAPGVLGLGLCVWLGNWKEK